MPADLWTDALRMATSGLLVASVAVPVGLIARALRPKDEPHLPKWKPLPVPWNGYEVLVAFTVVMFVLPPVMHELLAEAGFFQAVYGAGFPMPKAKDGDLDHLKEANTLRWLWAGLLVLPVQLGALLIGRRMLHAKWKFPDRGSVFGKVSLAVLAWLVLTPVVLAFNVVVNELSKGFGLLPETHPLTKLGSRPMMDQVLFALQTCVAAPLREEIIVRGVVLWWCVGWMRIPGAGTATPVAGARPWCVMIAAATFAAMSAKWQPMVFAGLLALGLAVLWRFTRTGARRARAVYATAALFALMHEVWPNPIPLFVLGLGLGWLAVRTNGLLVPVLVHALFNAVSVVFVLRSAT